MNWNVRLISTFHARKKSVIDHPQTFMGSSFFGKEFFHWLNDETGGEKFLGGNDWMEMKVIEPPSSS